MINEDFNKKIKDIENDIEENIEIIDDINESDDLLDEFIRNEEEKLQQKDYYNKNTTSDEKYFAKLNDEIFDHLIHNEMSNERNNKTSFVISFLANLINIFKIGFATCICIAITNYMINAKNLFTSQDNIQNYNEKMTEIEDTVNENFSKMSSLMKLSIKDTTNKISKNIKSK